MELSKKYAIYTDFFDSWENQSGTAALLKALSHILRQEKVDYSSLILRDFCQFFVGRDKSQLLEQLQRFVENGWFTNEGKNHIALLEEALHEPIVRGCPDKNKSATKTVRSHKFPKNLVQ